MTTFHTRRMFVPIPSLVPEYAGQWGLDDSYWREEWGVRRQMHFMPWNDHVVSEGYVDNDDFNLKRALREYGVNV